MTNLCVLCAMHKNYLFPLLKLFRCHKNVPPTKKKKVDDHWKWKTFWSRRKCTLLEASVCSKLIRIISYSKCHQKWTNMTFFCFGSSVKTIGLYLLAVLLHSEHCWVEVYWDKSAYLNKNGNSIAERKCNFLLKRNHFCNDSGDNGVTLLGYSPYIGSKE